MNHRNVWVVPVSALICVAALTMTGGSYTVPVPAGTAIVVHLNDSLSSSSASAGQTFEVTVAQPLVLQGWAVAQKGAAGQGHVVAVTRAGTSGKSGSVSVQFDWVTTVSGQQIAVVATKGKSSPLVFSPTEGPFAGNFQKGKDVTAETDLAIPVYTSVDRVVTINAGP
jgi:hypothetical protein